MKIQAMCSLTYKQTFNLHKLHKTQHLNHPFYVTAHPYHGRSQLDPIPAGTGQEAGYTLDTLHKSLLTPAPPYRDIHNDGCF